MKSILQTTVAVFVMLTLGAVYAAAQQPAVTASQTVSGYVLGPDDEILIRGIEAPEISDKPDKPVLIGTNGNITLPLIGRVKAGGLTVEQLEAQLITRFKEFIQDPQISVTVTEFRSQPVSVFGAVTKPGVVHATIDLGAEGRVASVANACSVGDSRTEFLESAPSGDLQRWWGLVRTAKTNPSGAGESNYGDATVLDEATQAVRTNASVRRANRCN